MRVIEPGGNVQITTTRLRMYNTDRLVFGCPHLREITSKLRGAKGVWKTLKSGSGSLLKDARGLKGSSHSGDESGEAGIVH
jgi:hypothetical protein